MFRSSIFSLTFIFLSSCSLPFHSHEHLRFVKAGKVNKVIKSFSVCDDSVHDHSPQIPISHTFIPGNRVVNHYRKMPNVASTFFEKQRPLLLRKENSFLFAMTTLNLQPGADQKKTNAKKSNKFAVAAAIFAILTFPLPFIGIGAVILGTIALIQLHNRPNESRHGLAFLSMLVGVVAIGILIFVELSFY